MAQIKPELTQKMRIYLSLVPIFGVVPAIIAIATNKSSVKLQQASRTALVLFFIWLFAYLGTDNSTEVTQQLVNGSVSSLYFLALIGMMLRTALHK